MQVLRPSKDKVYLSLALTLAQRSTCLDKQVGCVIVNAKSEIIATGYNGSPRGELHCIDLGYCIKDAFHNPNRCPSAHAEQNALTQCRVPEQIHTIYLTLSPCVSCIRIIMNTTCERIVFTKEHRHPEAKQMWRKEWTYYDFNANVQ